MSTIKRSKRQTPFVQIDKRPLQDKTLSWKAKGILAYLLSLPDDWQVYVSELKDHATDGRDSTSGGLKELIKQGYVVREKKRSDGGRFEGYEYTVFETRQKETPKTDKPETEKPSTVNPKTDKPKSENLQLLILNNKDIEDTNKYNGKKDLPKLSVPSFDEFWEKYDHKKNKKPAVASWKKLKPQDKINAVVAIPQYLKYLIANTHPQCHASTWLNNRRWEDDNSIKANQPAPTPQDNHKLSDKYEPIYLDRVKAIHQKTNGRISYFTRTEFASWLKGGKNFERWRDRGLLEKDIPKKIKNTISYLATNTFAQQLRGNLQDFVEEAFKGKIKQIS